jgi:hypothetical protein
MLQNIYDYRDQHLCINYTSSKEANFKYHNPIVILRAGVALTAEAVFGGK